MIAAKQQRAKVTSVQSIQELILALLSDCNGEETLILCAKFVCLCRRARNYKSFNLVFLRSATHSQKPQTCDFWRASRRAGLLFHKSPFMLPCCLDCFNSSVKESEIWKLESMIHNTMVCVGTS